MQRRRDDPLPAPHFVLGHSGEVQCTSVAGAAFPRAPVLCVDAAHADPAPGGRHQQFVANAHTAGENGSGHHRTGARKREAAVDGEAKQSMQRPRGMRGCLPAQMLEKTLHAVPGQRRYLEHRHVREPPADKQFIYGNFDFVHPFGRNTVDLGQNHRAARDAEDAEDLEMLDGLGHHAVVRGDDQQCVIDAGCPGEHVMDELLVPGHVDESHHSTRIFAFAQRLVGVPEFDRDATRFLLFQPVGVDTGQRLDERRLAVVDMARGADQHERPSNCSINAFSSSAARHRRSR